MALIESVAILYKLHLSFFHTLGKTVCGAGVSACYSVWVFFYMSIGMCK